LARSTHDLTPPTVPAPPEAPPATRQAVVRAIDELVDECRVESLWYFRPGHDPGTDLERHQVLDAIQERSSRDVFRRAGTLKAWLSHHSSAGSVSS
jgi:uncharacterized protein (DUF362 family)